MAVFTRTFNSRERIFPLVLGDARLDSNWPDKTSYLGTGFFVGKDGIALTAAHVMPPLEFDSGKSVYAIIWDEPRYLARRVVACEKAGGNADIAAIRVERVDAPYLELSFDERPMGTDVWATGIPNDSLRPVDGLVRLFKGHIMRGGRYYELNFPAIRGMSGSPVGAGFDVVGIISDNHRSELLEDQHSEESEILPGFQRTLQVKTLQVMNFGRAEPLHRLGKAAFKALVAKVSEGA